MYTWNDGTYLVHHGIKGQKWGLRRFQNDDGSLTAAGRARYGYKMESTKKNAYKNAKAEYAKAKSASRAEIRKQSSRSFYDIDDAALDKAFNREKSARDAVRQAKRDYRTSNEYKLNKSAEQKAWKDQRRDAIRNTSRGARIGVFLLSGPIGLYSYNSLRAAGESGASAAAQAIVLNTLTGGLGNMAYSTIIARKEKDNY